MLNPLQSASLPLPAIFNRSKKRVRRKMHDPKWRDAVILGAASSALCTASAAFKLFICLGEPKPAALLTLSGELMLTWNQLSNTREALMAYRGYETESNVSSPNRSRQISLRNMGHCNMINAFYSIAEFGITPSPVGSMGAAAYMYWLARRIL